MCNPFKSIIAEAIKTANIKFPNAGNGTTWDQIYRSDEESLHLARAILAALDEKGLYIAKREENAQGS